MKPRYVLGKIHNILRLRRNVFSWCLGDRSNGFVKILIYHDIPASYLGQFRNHIKSLRSSYPFLNPDQFHSFMKGNYCINGLHLLIIFDDGFLSSKVAAAKVLAPLGIKAIFFVTANFIGLSDELQWKSFVSRQIFGGKKSMREIGPEHAPMSWQDLLWLRDHGYTIGSHTLNHMKLSSSPVQDTLRAEIIESGDILAKRLNIAIDDFAYPFGNVESVSSEALAVIQKRYKYCFSGIRGLNKSSTHPMSIFRDAVDLDDTVDYLKFKIENGLVPLYYKKSRMLQTMIKESI